MRTRAPYAAAHSGTEWPNAAAWQLERMKDGSVRIVESWNKRPTKFACFLRSGGRRLTRFTRPLLAPMSNVFVGLNNRPKTVERGFNLRERRHKKILSRLHEDEKRRHALPPRNDDYPKKQME